MVASSSSKALTEYRPRLFLLPAGGASVHLLRTDTGEKNLAQIITSTTAPVCLVRLGEEYSTSHSSGTLVAMKYACWQSFSSKLVFHTGFVFILTSTKTKEVRSSQGRSKPFHLSYQDLSNWKHFRIWYPEKLLQLTVNFPWNLIQAVVHSFVNMKIKIS